MLKIGIYAFSGSAFNALRQPDSGLKTCFLAPKVPLVQAGRAQTAMK
jgi:hypothetical protein